MPVSAVASCRCNAFCRQAAGARKTKADVVPLMIETMLNRPGEQQYAPVSLRLQLLQLQVLTSLY